MQFQNYHANMKRLDITFTKFIKLHDCIPVNVGFAVYTQNFLLYLRFLPYSSFAPSAARERGTLFSGSWSFSVLTFQHHFVLKNLVCLQTERRAIKERISIACWIKVISISCHRYLTTVPLRSPSTFSLRPFQSIVPWIHFKTRSFYWEGKCCRELRCE